jgi:acetolactate synthase-1/2/3 large subunit
LSLTAHEGSAGFAADAMGRMTGKPGFCLATLGPGATNLATGVGCAYLDRTPMIAITCNLNTDQLGRRLQMYIDHHALFAPITKASLPLREGEIAATLQRALDIALTGPMGPVHLDLPEDVAIAIATETAPPPPIPKPQEAAPDNQILTANALLQNANRPVAVISANAMRMTNPDLLRAFVERHNIPFATTTMAKGMIDENHPLSIGCIERGKRQIQRTFRRDADLIVGLGYDTIEVEFEAWISDVKLLQIDIEKVDVAATVQVAGEVTGNLDSSLSLLSSIQPSQNDWTEATVSAHKRQFQTALRPETEAFSPLQAIDAVRAALPDDGILAFDVGAHTHQISGQWTAHAPRNYLITNGWSSMGFGLPAAIAAKIARPDLPVVCMIGDGCFQMTCGELATAARAGIALPVVVLDDRSLGLSKIKQSQRQFGEYGIELLPQEYGVPPAHYFGVPVVGVRDSDALRDAVTSALAASGPTVIEAVIDSDHYMETVFD